MASSERAYTFDQVMAFSIHDLPEHRILDIDGICDFKSARQDQCQQHLQDLLRQAHEPTDLAPANSAALRERLNQLFADHMRDSLSPMPSVESLPPNKDDGDDEVVHIETEAYNALIEEGGIPSHPLDTTFAICRDPGQYEQIISYWKAVGSCSSDVIVFQKQLTEWRHFRAHQQDVRAYYVPRGRLSEYQQKVDELRYYYGRQSVLALHEDVNKQSSMQDWIEFQYRQYSVRRSWEECTEEAAAGIVSSRQALTDGGLLMPQEDSDLDNAGRQLAANSSRYDAGMASFLRLTLAERKSDLAVQRLKVAQSECVRQTIETAAWLAVAQEHLDSVRSQLQEEDERVETSDYTRGYSKAEDDVRAAGELYDLVGVRSCCVHVERSPLVARLHNEMDSMESQVKDLREEGEDLKLRGKLLDARMVHSQRERKMEQHEILVDWVEEQFQRLLHEMLVQREHGSAALPHNPSLSLPKARNAMIESSALTVTHGANTRYSRTIGGRIDKPWKNRTVERVNELRSSLRDLPIEPALGYHRTRKHRIQDEADATLDGLKYAGKLIVLASDLESPGKGGSKKTWA